MLSFVLLFSTLSQSIVATTVYAGNILMMEQDSELPEKKIKQILRIRIIKRKILIQKTQIQIKNRELKKARIQIK